ncbi:hypothetical protein WOSG25_160090 [Weissella oryzae SG25]|uniref:Uncharacterized protein n=1 Tax=Weissella oryzae (strain DSM 25784 / JCM 18191 / LMG 30913 / SG25) TaxID=1329250 RepID=A0A069CWI7_WEIOS|nr:hypothetical protein [Weissella oryzae]GAK31794.1 hypothetical protein WOSG25_160090 [Weissella oryzae SG25]
MEETKMRIDPHQFAMTFISSMRGEHQAHKSTEQLAKDALTSYLSAYFLIEKFNELDAKNFSSDSTSDWHQLSFDELLAKVTELNKY